MFKIEAMCEDKKLPLVLRALDGLVYDLMPIPVRNAEVTNGQVVAKGENNIIPALHKQLAALKADPIKSEHVKKSLVAIKCSPDSYSYAINKLIEQKLLKRIAKGQYKLL